MKAFTYKGELYLRAVPAKTLFHSTMVHEVVNRGDIFAIRVSDSQLTIIPGKSEVQHLEASVSARQAVEPSPLEKMAAELREAIAERRAKPANASVLAIGDSFHPNKWAGRGRYVVVEISDGYYWCDYFTYSGSKTNRRLIPVGPADLKEGFTRVD